MSVPYRSVFGQLLQFVPRAEFDALARQYGQAFHSKVFPSMQQFVAMLFMQLGRADSQRGIELGAEVRAGEG